MNQSTAKQIDKAIVGAFEKAKAFHRQCPVTTNINWDEMLDAHLARLVAEQPQKPSTNIGD